MELTYKKSVNITRNININFVATIYDISFNQIELSVHIPCYENDGILKDIQNSSCVFFFEPLEEDWGQLSDDGLYRYINVFVDGAHY